MNFIIDTKQNVNSKLIKKAKSFNLKTFEKHIELSKTPRKFFHSSVLNWLNYIIITQYNWRAAIKILGIDHHDLIFFKNLFRNYGFDYYYELNSKELNKKYYNKNYLAEMKKNQPDWAKFKERFKYKKFDQACKFANDLSERACKALYAACYRLHKGKKVFQREIGIMIGTSRQNINQHFKELKEAGYIEYEYIRNGKVNEYNLTEKGTKFFEMCFDLTQLILTKVKAQNIIKPSILNGIDSTIINLSLYKSSSNPYYINKDVLVEKEQLEKGITDIENRLTFHERHLLFYIHPKYWRKYENIKKRIKEINNRMEEHDKKQFERIITGNKFTDWLKEIKKIEDLINN